jgi:sucrose-6-phosphate hydrolase SacC (GH32 family)
MPAPLYRDPIHDGAADPTLIYQRERGEWWMVYTNRRADAVGPRQSWFHGTDLGVATSADRGASWTYRGTIPGLEFEFGRNTFWAPEIIWHEGTYHMFCSYIQGVPAYSGDADRTIHHYTSPDMERWTHHGPITLATRQAIDACIYRLPNGRWRLWYKDSVAGQHTYAADSSDLFEWSTVGPVITDSAHEGPNVFELAGHAWMVVDGWQGQSVYRSDDFESWTRQGLLLSASGTRTDDQGPALHADVVVTGSTAEIFYFTHPDRTGRPDGTGLHEATYADRRSSIQSATLQVTDGRLVCDRDAEHVVDLGAPED